MRPYSTHYALKLFYVAIGVGLSAFIGKNILIHVLTSPHPPNQKIIIIIIIIIIIKREREREKRGRALEQQTCLLRCLRIKALC